MSQKIRRAVITVCAAVAVLSLANHAYAIELTAHGMLIVAPILDSVSLLLLGSALTFVGSRLKRTVAKVS